MADQDQCCRPRKEGAVAQDASPASESTNAKLSDRELEGVAGGTGRWIRREDDTWELRLPVSASPM